MNTFSFLFFQFFFLPILLLTDGKYLFRCNCQVCHPGGSNLIIPERNLSKLALENNGMNDLKNIEYQILNGKNGMPSFSSRLSAEEIRNLALYVLSSPFENETNLRK